MVEIEAMRFLESGVALVECPDCDARAPSNRVAGPAVQVSRQTQNDYSQYRATVGQAGNGLGSCWRRENVTPILATKLYLLFPSGQSIENNATNFVSCPAFPPVRSGCEQ